MELENIKNITGSKRQISYFSSKCRSDPQTVKCAHQVGENVGEGQKTKRES